MSAALGIRDAPPVSSISSGLDVEHETGYEFCALSVVGLQELVRAFENVNLHRVEGTVVGHDLAEFEEGVVSTPKNEARRLVFAVVCRNGRETGDV
jgi:hypothetical protein